MYSSVSGWLAPGVSFSFSLDLFSIAYIPMYSLFQPAPPIPPLPAYWSFSFLLDQSGTLGGLDETAKHLYIIKQIQQKQMHHIFA